MPPIETFHCHDDAVYWRFSGRQSDTGGEPLLDPPVDIKVRWELGRTEGVDPQGNVIALDGLVVVRQKVEILSVMWRGTLNQWYGHESGTGSEGAMDELMQVRTYTEVPDLKRRKFRRVAGVVFLRGQLPQVVGG